MDIGCKMKRWKLNDAGFADEHNFYWVPSGQLLEDGACVNDDYDKNFLRETEKRRIYTTIEYQKIRIVDAKEQSMELDLTLRMKWKDPEVKFKFSTDDKEIGGMVLSPEATSQIWTPDVHIKNRTYFKQDEEWKSLISSKILTATNEVELRYEMKFAVYCRFDHSTYPMDKQTCNVSIGSASNSEIFVLHPVPVDINGTYHVKNKYRADNFDMAIQFYDNGIDYGNNIIGIMVSMCRLPNAFIFMYYLPCITIVLVSLIGFVIPVSAIPGRIALLVTQFLTLTNLSINQMVRINMVIIVS